MMPAVSPMLGASSWSSLSRPLENLAQSWETALKLAPVALSTFLLAPLYFALRPFSTWVPIPVVSWKQAVASLIVHYVLYHFFKGEQNTSNRPKVSRDNIFDTLNAIRERNDRAQKERLKTAFEVLQEGEFSAQKEVRGSLGAYISRLEAEALSLQRQLANISASDEISAEVLTLRLEICQSFLARAKGISFSS